MRSCNYSKTQILPTVIALLSDEESSIHSCIEDYFLHCTAAHLKSSGRNDTFPFLDPYNSRGNYFPQIQGESRTMGKSQIQSCIDE